MGKGIVADPRVEAVLIVVLGLVGAVLVAWYAENVGAIPIVYATAGVVSR